MRLVAQERLIRRVLPACRVERSCGVGIYPSAAHISSSDVMRPVGVLRHGCTTAITTRFACRLMPSTLRGSAHVTGRDLRQRAVLPGTRLNVPPRRFPLGDPQDGLSTRSPSLATNRIRPKSLFPPTPANRRFVQAGFRMFE